MGLGVLYLFFIFFERWLHVLSDGKGDRRRDGCSCSGAAARTSPAPQLPSPGQPRIHKELPELDFLDRLIMLG